MLEEKQVNIFVKNKLFLLPDYSKKIIKKSHSEPNTKKMQADTGVLAPILYPVVHDGLCLKLLLPWLFVRDLYKLSRVNTEFYHGLMESGEGMRFWIQVAARVVSWPTKGFHYDEIVKDLKQYSPSELFPQLRCLVCPWTSNYECFQTGSLLRVISTPERMLLSRDGAKIIFQTDEADEFRNIQASCPSRKGLDFYDGVTQVEPRNKEAAPEENQFEQAFALMPSLLSAHPGFPSMYSKEFSYFVVHGGAVAIAEFFKGECSSPVQEDRGGVYIFSCHDGRMLRHLDVFGFMTKPRSFFMQCAPKQLWVYNREHLHRYCYQELKAPVLVPVVERVDPALWLAAAGDASSAVAQMTQILMDFHGVPGFRARLENNPRFVLNFRSKFNKRTMLHYAAMEGQAEACKELLERGADLNSEDVNMDRPLHLAIRAGHHQVIELLLAKYTAFHSENIRMCIRALDYPIQATVDEDSILMECRATVPMLFRALVFRQDDTSDSLERDMSLLFLDALKLPRVLASSDAVAIIFQNGGHLLREVYMNRGWIKQVFIVHDRKVQELETTRTLRFFYEELGFPVNEAGFSLFFAEPPLVYAVQNGGLETVKFLIQDMGADVRLLSNKNGRSIYQLAWNRVNTHGNPRDIYEARKIRHYLRTLLHSQLPEPGRDLSPPPAAVEEWEA